MIRYILTGLLALSFAVPAVAQKRIKSRHKHGVEIQGQMKVSVSGDTSDVLPELVGLDSQKLPMNIFLQGTLGNPTGPASDGVLIGVLTETAALCQQDDGTVFTSYTSECATGNDDVILLPAVPAANDAFYFGHATSPFAKIDVDTTNGTSGDTVLTVVWEYYNVDTTWDTLTFGRQDAVDFDESVGSLINTFQPPSDWGSVAVNSVTGYWIRMRVTAYTSSTTDPQADTVVLGMTTIGTGLNMPSAGTISSVGFSASTVSGTNANSTFLLMNLTQGTHSLATFDKTTIIDNDDITDLAIVAGDDLAVLQLQEDGTTEHADVNLLLWLDL